MIKLLMMKFVKEDLEPSLEEMWYCKCGQGVNSFANNTLIFFLEGRLIAKVHIPVFLIPEQSAFLCSEK